MTSDASYPEEPSSEGEAAPGASRNESDELEFSASISDRQMLSWESQVGQYEASGPPGISYFRGQLSEALYVDCLLYREAGGDLVGILNHYPSDVPPFQHVHDLNIWVRPDRRRRGIASALLLEAYFQWGPFPEGGEPRLTESGAQFLGGLAKLYQGSEFDYTGDWEAWHERRAHEREEPESDWRSPAWELWHKRRAEELDDRAMPAGTEGPSHTDHGHPAE